MKKVLLVLAMVMFGTTIAKENSNNKIVTDCFDIAIAELQIFEFEFFELNERDATNFLNRAYADCYCLYESSDLCGF